MTRKQKIRSVNLNHYIPENLYNKKDSLKTVFFYYRKETNGLSLFFSFIITASILFSDFICN